MARKRPQRVSFQERLKTRIEQTLDGSRGGGRAAELSEEFKNPGSVPALLSALDDPRALAEPNVPSLRLPAYYLLQQLATHRAAEAVPRAMVLARDERLREVSIRLLVRVGDRAAADAIQALHHSSDEKGQQKLLDHVWHYSKGENWSAEFVNTLASITIERLGGRPGFDLKKSLIILARLDPARAVSEMAARGMLAAGHPDMPVAVEALAEANPAPDAAPILVGLAGQLIDAGVSAGLDWQRSLALINLMPILARLDSGQTHSLTERLRNLNKHPFPHAIAKAMLSLKRAEPSQLLIDFSGKAGPGAPFRALTTPARYVVVARRADHILMHGEGFRELFTDRGDLYPHVRAAWKAVGAKQAVVLFDEAQTLANSEVGTTERWRELDERYQERDEDLGLLLDQYVVRRARHFRPRKWRRRWHPYWWLVGMGQRGQALAIQWAIASRGWR